jgi:predicted amidohydrolase
MANYIKVAAIGPRPAQVAPDMKSQEIVDFMINFWREEFKQVLSDKPDLIIVPECCDRPAPVDFPLERRLEYYRCRKNQIQNFFAETAKEYGCYIIYSAVREVEDGSWRNSNIVLDRNGKIAGIYNKNHIVMEREKDEAGILCGKDAPVIKCDFGRVACLICFDLNFAPLLAKYVKAKPDLLVFTSVYHGSHIVQSWWAYSCRAHFVSAVAGLPSEIRDPYGRVLASSTNYRDYTVGRINLDCCMAHNDNNWNKLSELKKKYGGRVNILDPGYFGSVLIYSETEDITAIEMAKEFEIELLDDYLTRQLLLHQKAENIEK